MKRLLFILAFLAPAAFATDVWFPDVKASSQNGTFLAKAESPENRKKHPAPFQGDFTYSLTDTRTHKLLWRYKGGRDSEPAGQLFVSNSGKVIALGGRDSLTLFRRSGEHVAMPDVFQLLPRREVAKYCDETSAGTLWDQFSWTGFADVSGKEYFYIRTYWGRYILVDLERSRLSADRTVRKQVEFQVLEEARKIESLPRSKYRTYCPKCGMYEVNPDIQKGIFVLVLHHEKGIKPFLRLILSAHDDIYPDPKDYLPRLGND
jgi:hypothetical protein